MRWEFEFDFNLNSRAPEGNMVVPEIEFGRFPAGMDTGSESQGSIFASKSTLEGTCGVKARICGRPGGPKGRSSPILGTILEAF